MLKFMCVFIRSGSHVAAAAGLHWDDSYPFVCSVVPKNLNLKGYVALPLPLQPQENRDYSFMWTRKTEGKGEGLKG